LQFVEHAMRVQRRKQKTGGRRPRTTNKHQLFPIVGSKMSGGDAPLPLPRDTGRIAGPGLDPVGSAPSANGVLQVARDVDGERYKRRNVERVEAEPCALNTRPVETGFFSRSPNPEGEKAPQQSAKIPPESCRRRLAPSAARSGPHALREPCDLMLRAATSRAKRTIFGNGPAAARPSLKECRKRGRADCTPRGKRLGGIRGG